MISYLLGQYFSNFLMPRTGNIFCNVPGTGIIIIGHEAPEAAAEGRPIIDGRAAKGRCSIDVRQLRPTYH